MIRRRIFIKGIKIRLPGVSVEQARLLAQGLGHEVLSRLDGTEKLRDGKANVDRIDGGSIQTSRGMAISDLRQSVAGRITKALTLAAKRGT